MTSSRSHRLTLRPNLAVLVVLGLSALPLWSAPVWSEPGQSEPTQAVPAAGGNDATTASAKPTTKQPETAAAPDPLLTDPAPTLKPLDVHPRTSMAVVEQLRHNHFVSKTLNDDLSAEVLDNYLELLDGDRVFLLAADVAAFERYRARLDEALIRGDLGPAYDMFNVFQQRQVERLQFLLAELGRGIDALDFTEPDVMETERKDAPWPANTAELDALWRQRLKAAVLTLKLSDKPVADIQELLTKRYRTRLKQALQTKSEDVFQLYVNAFAAIYDPHTQYFSPRTSQNFNINMSLSLEGIGAVLRSDEEYTSVAELVPAGPADKSGLLKPSDKIVSVGQGDTGPLIDVVGWRLDDVVELIRGPKASKVRLEIIPHLAEDSGTRVITITRNTVQLEEQAAHSKRLSIDDNGITRQIGIIEIPTFYADFKAMEQGDPNYRSTTRDVERLIRELKTQGIDGLVIDLRNNGGGSLQEADALTGLFIASGPTVQVKSASRRPAIYADTDDQTIWTGPMAVLVNRLSASASEIFAGAIQDYGRGLVLGSQTFGKGSVQTLIPLNRGQLKVTAAKFYRISGESTQHRGVLPDIAFPELFNTDQIGESALDDAMPWDMIASATYQRTGELGPVIPALNERHNARVADDADFVYLRELEARARDTAEETEVSLNLEERKREKADADRWRLDVENRRRGARGKPPLASLEELETALEAEEEELEDPANDPLLREGAHVLSDYITLTKTPDASHQAGR